MLCDAQQCRWWKYVFEAFRFRLISSYYSRPLLVVITINSFKHCTREHWTITHHRNNFFICLLLSQTHNSSNANDRRNIHIPISTAITKIKTRIENWIGKTRCMCVRVSGWVLVSISIKLIYRKSNHGMIRRIRAHPSSRLCARASNSCIEMKKINSVLLWNFLVVRLSSGEVTSNVKTFIAGTREWVFLVSSEFIMYDVLLWKIWFILYFRCKRK